MVFAFYERVKGMDQNEVYVIHHKGKRLKSPFESTKFKAGYEKPGLARSIITRFVNSLTDKYLQENYKDEEWEWYYAPKSLREEIEAKFRADFEIVPYGPKK